MEATYGTFKVKVPQNVAREFKSLWDGIVKSASFCVKNDKLAIESISFRMPDGTTEFTTVE
jgi:hypothetical protein